MFSSLLCLITLFLILFYIKNDEKLDLDKVPEISDDKIINNEEKKEKKEKKAKKIEEVKEEVKEEVVVNKNDN